MLTGVCCLSDAAAAESDMSVAVVQASTPTSLTETIDVDIPLEQQGYVH